VQDNLVWKGPHQVYLCAVKRRHAEVGRCGEKFFVQLYQ